MRLIHTATWTSRSAIGRILASAGISLARTHSDCRRGAIARRARSWVRVGHVAGPPERRDSVPLIEASHLAVPRDGQRRAIDRLAIGTMSGWRMTSVQLAPGPAHRSHAGSAFGVVRTCRERANDASCQLRNKAMAEYTLLSSGFSANAFRTQPADVTAGARHPFATACRAQPVVGCALVGTPFWVRRSCSSPA